MAWVVLHENEASRVTEHNLMFALRDYRREMARDAKGEAPEASWGPTKGVGAWMVA